MYSTLYPEKPLFGLFLMLLPALAAANDFDNIIVTASRTPLSKIEAGNAITVITRDQIEQRQARYVTDMLRSVPGFAVSYVGTTGSQTQVRVRGSEANHVLVLIDGIKANDPATGDEFRWEYLATGNVDRIEIVRGPQSALWGSDAVGAVVNIITRSDYQSANFGAYGEGGTYSTVNAGLTGGTGSDNWSLSYGLEQLSTDGTNISRSGDESDGSRLTTASLGGQYDAGKSWSFDATLRFVDAASNYDPVDFLETGLPTDGDRETETEQLNAQVGASYDTFEGRLKHRLSARFVDTDNVNNVDGEQDSTTASDRTR